MNLTVLKISMLGSRTSWGRIIGVATGVAVGVCVLLLLWGAANGLSQRDARGAWLRELGQPEATALPASEGAQSGPAVAVPLTPEKILMGSGTDIYRDRNISHRDVAGLSSSTVKIPGVPAVPAPGSYYASPALQKLIDSAPADELGNRYGKFIGTIDDAALPGPDSLVVLKGATESQVRQGPSASIVTSFTSNPYGDSAVGYRTALLIGGIAVLFPVLLLISISASLGAAQRRERYATLRLIGASPRLVSAISGLETAVPSLAGALAGVVLAWLLQPAAAQIPVNGGRIFQSDMVAGAGFTVFVVLLVVFVSAFVAAIRTSKAGIGPLGLSRAMQEKTPRFWRGLPLLMGLAAMAGSVLMVKTQNADPITTPLLLVGGFAAVTVGIVVIGPWLTRLVSTLGLRRARSAAAVIANSRIRQTPVATFRAVSGLVIAVFMVSIFAGTGSALGSAELPEAKAGLLPPTSVYAILATGYSSEYVGVVAQSTAGLAGIQNVTVGYAKAELGKSENMDVYVAAADVVNLGFNETPPNEIVAFDSKFLAPWTKDPVPLRPAPVDSLTGLTPVLLVAQTDGMPAAIDRARTALNISGVTRMPASSRADGKISESVRLVEGLSALAYAGVFLAIVIAGISLAISTAAAILDRRRALGLMRLAGMPISAIRHVIAREAVVPLLAVLLLAIGVGFLTSWLMVTPMRSISWPNRSYYLALGTGMLLALAAVWATFGLVRGNTAVETTRFE